VLPATDREVKTPPRVLVLFFDGVGIGESDPLVNPFLRADLPVLAKVSGGRLPTLESPFGESVTGRAFPLDACLGVPGTPQSGTGQVSLLTGRNAAKIFGRHFGPWPPVSLRPILQDENFLRHSVELGAKVIFANAYPEGYPDALQSRRDAAPPIAARAAGILDRTERELAEGRAIASEILNDSWIERLGHSGLPRVTPEVAGANLAHLAAGADLTFFAHYHTDFAGHRGGIEGGVQALERVDRFLAGLLAHLPPDLLVLGSSDHGNIEDVRVGHTRNPVLGFAIGPEAAALPAFSSILDLAGVVLHLVTARLGYTSGQQGIEK
jgi:hypothetical protein